jgi:DNA polymerase III epsilon subunit-like protein
MNKSFVAVDFETANEDFASICQIGLAEFDGSYIGGDCMVVNPEDEFSGMNISIHGITESDVSSEPTFLAVYENSRRHCRGRLLYVTRPLIESPYIKPAGSIHFLFLNRHGSILQG